MQSQSEYSIYSGHLSGSSTHLHSPDKLHKKLCHLKKTEEGMHTTNVQPLILKSCSFLLTLCPFPSFLRHFLSAPLSLFPFSFSLFLPSFFFPFCFSPLLPFPPPWPPPVGEMKISSLSCNAMQYTYTTQWGVEMSKVILSECSTKSTAQSLGSIHRGHKATYKLLLILDHYKRITIQHS